MMTFELRQFIEPEEPDPIQVMPEQRLLQHLVTDAIHECLKNALRAKQTGYRGYINEVIFNKKFLRDNVNFRYCQLAGFSNPKVIYRMVITVLGESTSQLAERLWMSIKQQEKEKQGMINNATN